jgi:hypothetical protein
VNIVDPLEKWQAMIEWADTWTEHVKNDSPVEQARYNYQRCISGLASALRAERERVADLDRLEERVAELEAQLEARIAELASSGDGE